MNIWVKRYAGSDGKCALALHDVNGIQFSHYGGEDAYRLVFNDRIVIDMRSYEVEALFEMLKERVMAANFPRVLGGL